METKYSHDSLGAPIEIVDDEPTEVGKTFKDQPIHDDEKVLTHEAFVSKSGEWVTNYLFEDDIQEYVKTLERDDLLEILSNMDVKEIKEAANMEEVYL